MSQDIQIVSVRGANGEILPINGTSIGSKWGETVKQERADEAEIQAIAAEMMETQKAALAKQQQQAAQLAARQQSMNAAGGSGLGPNVHHSNGQTNMLNYLQRQSKGVSNGGAGSTPAISSGVNLTSNGVSQRSSSICSTDSDKNVITDEESQKGHFGWTTFNNKVHIPYIFRNQDKYVSVRMVEQKLISKYLNCLHADIYSSCTSVRSYFISDTEARLLWDINNKHCDNEFGNIQFTQKDLIVRLSDATKFYQFLEICYRKLMSGSKSPSEKCGFIRINKESVVPYTVRNNEQVVPLFYFEGETENLKQKADYLSGWDLAYLKFCCKVQGIRNELFSSDNVAVISLTDIKSYFPNGTEFEDYWPSKVVETNLLLQNNALHNPNRTWTRLPSQPPPKVLSQQQTNHAANVQKMASGQAQHNAAVAAAVHQQQQSLLKRGAANAANSAFVAQTAAAAAAAVAAAASMPGNRLHSNPALTQATVQITRIEEDSR